MANAASRTIRAVLGLVLAVVGAWLAVHVHISYSGRPIRWMTEGKLVEIPYEMTLEGMQRLDPAEFAIEPMERAFRAEKTRMLASVFACGGSVGLGIVLLALGMPRPSGASPKAQKSYRPSLTPGNTFCPRCGQDFVGALRDGGFCPLCGEYALATTPPSPTAVPANGPTGRPRARIIGGAVLLVLGIGLGVGLRQSHTKRHLHADGRYRSHEMSLALARLMESTAGRHGYSGFTADRERAEMRLRAKDLWGALCVFGCGAAAGLGLGLLGSGISRRLRPRPQRHQEIEETRESRS